MPRAELTKDQKLDAFAHQKRIDDEEIAKLRKALEWYAADQQKGKKARAALREK